MNNPYSQEMDNSVADRMHLSVLKMNKVTDEMFHDLDAAGDGMGDWRLQEKLGEARALRDQLSRVLLSIEDDLRQQVQFTSEMMEIYAPPELMGEFMAGFCRDDEEYPKNYQSSAQDSEQTIKEPDWRDGDTIGFCPHCFNLVSASAVQCPSCGAMLKILPQ